MIVTVFPSSVQNRSLEECLNCQSVSHHTMSLSGRVIAISAGVFIGGGVGFYLRETYYVKKMEERAERMETKLNELTKQRRKMEKLLKTK